MCGPQMKAQSSSCSAKRVPFGLTCTQAPPFRTTSLLEHVPPMMPRLRSPLFGDRQQFQLIFTPKEGWLDSKTMP